MFRMTTPVSVRFEFSYVTVADNLPTTFALGGIAVDVADAIKNGLTALATIKLVVCHEVIESKQVVDLP